MYGQKVIPNRHGDKSAGKRKMCRSRLADEDTQGWEADFREFMDDDDDDDGIEPFLTEAMAESCKRDSLLDAARPKRRRVSPSHPYRGIRQRPSGRCSAEIRNPVKGVRVWIGTFDTAKHAARAFDAEARRIHGTKAKTNFPTNKVALCSCYRSPPSSRSTADGRDLATESTSTSSEVCSTLPSDTRIMLECCSDDVMESLLASCDMPDNMERPFPNRINNDYDMNAIQFVYSS